MDKLPKAHGATLLYALVFILIVVIGYHFTLGRR